MKVEEMVREHIRPSSPTPSHLRDFQLSFIDERIPPSYIPLIIYYDIGENIHVMQSDISLQLKSSLSDALVHFYPLAGRMKGQTLVDCNDEGILYTEASADSKILDVVKNPDPLVLDKLIPFKSNGNISSAVEQLAVQVTWFNHGGIAVGICISHRIADCSTLSSFIRCWAALARGDCSNAIFPVFNSATLFPPRGTPDFRPNPSSPSVQQPLAANLAMRRFVFTSSAIDALRMNVKRSMPCIFKPTRVEVVSAYLWNSCLVAKGVKSGKSVAYHPVNLRGRISALTEHSFGNIFQMARAINTDDTGEVNWIHLVEKLRAAFRKINSKYAEELLGDNGFHVAKENFMEISKFLKLENVQVLRFSSYCNFPFYEADLGWGKPVWVSSGSYVSKDSILLFDSIESTGGIEAWIVMDAQEMTRLEQNIQLLKY